MVYFFSFIIPVYNRPEEIKELLESFEYQDFVEEYEIVIVEDGSSQSSEEIVNGFGDLPISYFMKANTGPGASRNYGMQRAKGNYFIILDSDCILPRTYISTVKRELEEDPVDFYGGADTAQDDFSPLQKAINYSMTSFFTTGGLRGSENNPKKFQPRSFNMGISKEAFMASGGFGDIHPGEDPDLTLRLWDLGYKSCFIPDAAVFHKRRISWSSFYTQVRKFGLVRPILNLWHPQSARLTYWFPTIFMLILILSVPLLFFGVLMPFWLCLLYLMLILVDAAIKNHSAAIGVLAACATVVQFAGYGLGFIESMIEVRWFKKLPQERFPYLFFN